MMKETENISKEPDSDWERSRVNALLSYDLDYTQPQTSLDGLTQLAASIAGAEVSLVNLIDNYTQWSVSCYGLEVMQTPREETACQYTIQHSGDYEIKDLDKDPRFKDRGYDQAKNGFRHYYGIPLASRKGFNIGTLCVVSSCTMDISEDKARMLRIVATQVMERLDLNFDLQSLRTQMRALSHDVRSPISGIISMSEVLQEQIVEEESKEELLESSRMIELSGKELLVLTEEILQSENYLNKIDQREGNDWNLDVLQKKLFALYHPQAQKKEIELKIDIKEEGGQFFSKDSLLQIAGNLIANSIKFTDKDGSIRVTLSIVKLNNQTILSILVKDNGVGMDASQVELLHSKEKNCQSKPGTNQEKGYGYGLQLVKELLDQRSGQWRIVSAPGEGTEITVQIPIQ